MEHHVNGLEDVKGAGRQHVRGCGFPTHYIRLLGVSVSDKSVPGESRALVKQLRHLCGRSNRY